MSVSDSSSDRDANVSRGTSDVGNLSTDTVNRAESAGRGIEGDSSGLSGTRAESVASGDYSKTVNGVGEVGSDQSAVRGRRRSGRRVRGVRGGIVGGTGGDNNVSDSDSGARGGSDSRTTRATTREFDESTSKRSSKDVKDVPYESLFDASSKAALELSSLAGVASAPFWLAANLGLGPHWMITEEEAETLAKSIQAYYKSLPRRGKNASRIVKLLEKHLPLAMLLVTVTAILAPRVSVTIKERQKNVFSNKNRATNGKSQSSSAGVGTVPPGAGANATSYDSVKSYFESGAGVGEAPERPATG